MSYVFSLLVSFRIGLFSIIRTHFYIHTNIEIVYGTIIVQIYCKLTYLARCQNVKKKNKNVLNISRFRIQMSIVIEIWGCMSKMRQIRFDCLKVIKIWAVEYRCSFNKNQTVISICLVCIARIEPVFTRYIYISINYTSKNR